MVAQQPITWLAVGAPDVFFDTAGMLTPAELTGRLVIRADEPHDVDSSIWLHHPPRHRLAAFEDGANHRGTEKDRAFLHRTVSG